MNGLYTIPGLLYTSGVKAPGIMILINLNNWIKNFLSTAAVSFFFLLPFATWREGRKMTDKTTMQCEDTLTAGRCLLSLNLLRIWNEGYEVGGGGDRY